MIFQADAIDFLRKMESKSVGAVVTSPPYNIGVDYAASDDTRADYIEWSIRWIAEAVRVSQGGLWMNVGGRASDQNQLYALLGAVAARHRIQNTIVWAKSVHAGGKTHGHFKPINSRRYVNNCHELIVHVVADLVDINRLAVGVPYEDQSNVTRFAGASGGVRCRGSVWAVHYPTKRAGDAHPAAYPVELAEKMILLSGARSVVDPFVGSGTTALAARALGVDFVGCDLSDAYVALAKERLAA